MKLEDFYSGLNNLYAQKDAAAADDYFARHLEAAGNSGNIGYQLAVLNEQVGYYRVMSRVSQSFAACEQAMAIISAPDFMDSISAATTMLNVATAFRAGGRITEALELYGRVDEIYSAALEADDARRAALYNNMAQAWAASGDKKTALAYLHNALTVLEASQENSDELATTHSNIALIYMSLGNNKAAASHLELSMSVYEALGYDGAHCLAAMAQLLHIQKDYAGAVEKYRLALNKLEAALGKNADYARICRNCAQAYSMLGMQAEAEELVRTAQAVEDTLNSSNAPG